MGIWGPNLLFEQEQISLGYFVVVMDDSSPSTFFLFFEFWNLGFVRLESGETWHMGLASSPLFSASIAVSSSLYTTRRLNHRHHQCLSSLASPQLPPSVSLFPVLFCYQNYSFSLLCSFCMIVQNFEEMGVCSDFSGNGYVFVCL